MFLLTNFTEQGINEKIVQKVFVQDKAIFAEEDDSQEFCNFVNKIKNSVECFRKRLEVTKLEYEKLVEKKKKGKFQQVKRIGLYICIKFCHHMIM